MHVSVMVEAVWIEKPRAELPPSGKEYLCFHIYRKYSHASQCTKSHTLPRVIDLILEIESFEQQCVILKRLLQSDRLEQHIKTIGIYQ